MSNIRLIFCFLFCILLASCGEKNAGVFKLNMVVFTDADKGISDVHNIEFSRVYFIGKKMLEVIPNDNSYSYCFLDNKNYSGFFDHLDSLNFNVKKEISKKDRGAIPLAEVIPNYENRVNISDTILDNTLLKRFCINTENEYSVFYIGNDLKIPFSLNELIEKDYKGTIRRIDTYQRLEDRFISLRLNYTDTIPQKFYNILK